MSREGGIESCFGFFFFFFPGVESAWIYSRGKLGRVVGGICLSNGIIFAPLLSFFPPKCYQGATLLLLVLVSEPFIDSYSWRELDPFRVPNFFSPNSSSQHAIAGTCRINRRLHVSQTRVPYGRVWSLGMESLQGCFKPLLQA